MHMGTQWLSARNGGRLMSTCLGKADSRHRQQHTAAMWGGGPSAAGSAKFSKEAENWISMKNLQISKTLSQASKHAVWGKTHQCGTSF